MATTRFFDGAGAGRRRHSARGVVTPFAALREKAWRGLQRLSQDVSETAPPVRLHAVATRLHVRRVEFVPMVSTAGVKPIEDGYVILVNTTAAGASRVTKRHLEVTESDFDSLSVPLRFCIAHELAHIVFYDLFDGDCRNPVFQDHWEALENACNQMARALLIPRLALLRTLGCRTPSPHLFVHLAKAFRVSPEVFIRRLELEDTREIRLFPEDGLVAFVRDQGNGPKLLARHAWGPLARVRWPKDGWSPAGEPMDRFGVSKDLQSLFEIGEEFSLDVEVIWRQGQVAPCRLEITPTHKNPASAIVVLRFAGDLVFSSCAGLAK
jgi:hypothetical protein